MDPTEARRMFANLRDEMSTTERRLVALRKLAEGLTELFPELTDTYGSAELSRENRPKGQEAVRRVLVESRGKWFTVSLMLSELDKRGWLPESDAPANAVRAALTRVAAVDSDIKRGRGRRTGAVTYAYKPHVADEEMWEPSDAEHDEVTADSTA